MLIDVLVLFLVGATGAIASYFGAYFQGRGRNLATKKDFEDLLDQSRKTTEATEEIRNQIQRRFAFRDRVLLDRYTLVNDINKRLETVRIGYERIKKRQPTRIEIVNGETLLLTEIYADLQLSRWVLTPEFYELLSKRYELVCVLWQHVNNDPVWEEQMKLWWGLNDQIQAKIGERFEFREARV